MKNSSRKPEDKKGARERDERRAEAEAVQNNMARLRALRLKREAQKEK
jgi:hypothetical protein